MMLLMRDAIQFDIAELQIAAAVNDILVSNKSIVKLVFV